MMKLPLPTVLDAHLRIAELAQLIVRVGAHHQARLEQPTTGIGEALLAALK
jgi:hypothetical protein